MRFALLLIVVLTSGLASQIRAQAAAYELEAGLGYARLFDAGGISFAAGVDRALSPADAGLRHAVGGSFWYAHTGIESFPEDSEGRHTVGLGARYRMMLGGARAVRPFLAVPLQVLHSEIPDRAALQAGPSLVLGVPENPPPVPVEDHIGGQWGWGAGLELGVRLRMGQRLSGQTSVQGLYQEIYQGSSRNSAWSWHAGISYGL